MDIAELEAARDSLETALITYGGGTASVKIGDREITYSSTAGIKSALNMVIRAIARYNQQNAGNTPGIRVASFRNG